MHDLFGFVEGGYGLKSFEIYNWGIFDEHIVKINCDNESTLLTGNNGSGKTSIVDALITLLVESKARHYNQSSGAEKKKERTEESYVLGVYGNNEENGKMKLREKKNCVSILNGIFENKGSAKTLSLLQVRYFSSDGILKQVYATTEQELTIEMLQKELNENESYIPEGRWKKIIEKKFKTAFFDSFDQYFKSFSSYFGFKSKKATKVFSKTVGLKNLDNFTKFIQEDMLEEGSIDIEFEKMRANFNNLIDSHNNILKSKKQIELLEPILKTGREYREEKAKEERYRHLLDVLPFWYAKTAVVLYEENLNKLYHDLELEQNKENIFTAKKETLNDELNSVRNAISKNSVTVRIKEIDYEIQDKERDKKQILKRKFDFEKRLAEVEIAPPKNENEFIKTKNKIENLEKENSAKKEKFDKEKVALSITSEKLKEEIKIVKSELESLGKRNSNIPEKYIAMRREVSLGTGIPESALVFAGELIQVLPEEKRFENAIEKLLHHFAIALLVPAVYYDEVTKYVSKNHLQGRFFYIKIETEEKLFQYKNEFKSNSVIQKIAVKENHELKNWILEYLQTEFDYVCCENLDAFKKEEKALLDSGLIKTHFHHEKDDRYKENQVEKVLGWDNTEKRKSLSSRLDELMNEAGKNDISLSGIHSAINKCDTLSLKFSALFEFKNWIELDAEPLAKEIDKLTEEKKSLQENSDIKELYERESQLKNELKNIENELKIVLQSIGRYRDKIENSENKLNGFKTQKKAYLQDETQISLTKKFCAELENIWPQLTQPKSIATLEENHRKLQKDYIEPAIRGSLQRQSGLNTNLIVKMKDYKTPEQKIINKFPTWTSETADFQTNFSCLPDYENKFNELTKDDLPKYESEFKALLHRSLKNDIVTFNQEIKRELENIKDTINELNASLRPIIYTAEEKTILQLQHKDSGDNRIAQFKKLLQNALPNPSMEAHNDTAEEEKFFDHVRELIEFVEKDENVKNVLDMRKWFHFSASENYQSDRTKVFKKYEGTGSLSGGQKSKLTYTILAASISHQFGINSENAVAHSFRFVMIDEVFSKIDPDNAAYTVNLFKSLNLQFLFVTPNDKINIVEDYVSSLHIAAKISENPDKSIVRNLSIETFQKEKSKQQEMEKTMF